MSNTRAAKAEATGDRIAFEHEGITYHIDPASEWEVDVLEAVEDGKVTTAARALIGPVEWAAFKATKPKMSDLNSLMEAIAAAAGIQGN